MALTPGTRLGPYEVTAQVGAGGMEVYRATDTTLKRQVAIKVLPDALAADSERLARFQREAEVLAALNHPNIAHIRGLERSDGTTALVMELVEGPTLADRIAQGAIPVDEALPIAKQIAEGLEAAHEQGIIHRDLKPANIKVKQDGTVKVLDFGLAKALEPMTAASASVTMSPTITTPAMTQAGMILGTAAYMSPEQAKGRAADRRSDVWALGAVLFEMLTGRRAFGGEDVSETLADVMRVEPAWDLVPANLSPTLLTFLKRSLAKNPRQRLGDMQDMRLALEGAFETVAPAVAAMVARPLSGWRRWWPMAAALAAVLAAAIAVWATRPAVPDRRETRWRTFPAGPDPARLASLAVSPDGRWAIIGADRLWLWPLDSLDARPLDGTDGVRGHPFWSPDSRSVVFDAGGSLHRMDIAGGPAQTLIRGGNLGSPYGAWNSREVILFEDAAGGFSRMSAGGGDVTPVVRPQVPSGHLDLPAFLPDGIHFLYLDHTAGEQSGIHVASIDARPDAQPTAPILAADDGPMLVDDAGWDYPRMLFLREGELLAQDFDPDALTPVGDPVTVATGVAGGGGNGLFSASANGDVLLYRTGTAFDARTLVWVDRQGHEEPLDVPERNYRYARLSPDGTRVALDVQDQGQQRNIWVWDLVRHTLARLTFDTLAPNAPGNRSPVWTPDGTRIAFSRPDATGAEGIWWQPADGSGSPEALIEIPGKHIYPVTFPPDGTALLFHETGSPRDILRATIAGDRTPEPLLHGSFDEANPEISLDGRWLAYESDESGQSEVYVRPYPNLNGGRWQMSTGGGTRPLWNRNGRELFYYRPPGTMMAVPLEPGATFRPGTPAVLFEGRYPAPSLGRQYSISPDGRRFLMIKNAATDAEAPIIVVQNWADKLQQRASAAEP